MNRLLILLIGVLLISCANNNESEVPGLSKTERIAAAEFGQSMVKIGFSALSSELKAQISSKGMDSAIYACQLKANPIIDSVAKASSTSIQRITLKTRNPLNKPNKEEKQLLKLMQRAKKANEKLNPITFLIDSNTIAYYHPITIGPMCLNCHGEPGVSMQASTYETILSAYPMDKAINYKLDDLRGLWAVKFDKSALD